MKKLLTVLITLCISLSLFAKEAHNHEKCGMDEVHQRMLQEDPQYRLNQEAIEEHTRAIIANSVNNKVSNPEIITIPVVFHVVYNNASQNVSEEQLLSQIDVLNEDFRRLNADASSTLGIFQPVAADVEIEFCLAQSDPTGLPFGGITRTQTSVGAFGTDNAIKFDNSGGKDAWPNDVYLNFWVCDLSAGLLGYAQFPGGDDATDGIVCDYRYTGRIGNIANGVRGRTATHEVGHWLNLRHVWGDGDCSVDDFVDDTPIASGSNFGCPFGTNSCDEGPEDLPDMFQNYMDYSDDDCTNLYTIGQKNRMLPLFTPGAVRYDLSQSTACILPTLGANDAKLVEISNPLAEQTFCGQDVPLSVRVRNFGSELLTSMTINTVVNGNLINSYDWTGSLETGDFDDVSIANSPFNPGLYTVAFEIINVNGGTDVNPNDNTAETNIQVSGRETPIVEDFEEAIFPPPFYELQNPDEDKGWVLTNAVGHNSSQSMYVNCFGYGESGEQDDFHLPVIDLTGVQNPELTFYSAYARYNSDDTDTLEVMVSTDCGDNFTSVYKKFGIQLATAGNTSQDFVPLANQWKENTVDLSAFTSSTEVVVKFRCINSFENNMYVDDINVSSGNPTAIEDLLSADSFELFPNPASDFISYNSQHNNLNPQQFILYDMEGRVVLNKQLNQAADKIDLPSRLSSGIYMVSIVTSEGTFIEKITIQN